MTPSLIWTRAAADWNEDEAELRPLFEANAVLRLPCLRTAPRTPEVTDERCDYLVFTSANAARYGLAHPRLVDGARQARQIFTHGEKTAEALRAAGLHPHVIQSARTAADLCAWLGANIPRPARFGLPSAAEPAYPLATELEAHGFTASTWTCYATEAVATDTHGRELNMTTVAKYIDELRCVIAFASPSAVQGFAKVFRPASNRLGAALVAVAIGPTTETAASQYFQRVTVAKANTVESLIKAAHDTLRSL